MPGKSSVIATGNEVFSQVLYLTAVTYPTLGANASATTSLTVAGVQPLDILSWNLQSPPAHLQIDNMYVSAANTITVTWGTDATGITGASTAVLLLEVSRVDGANLGTSVFPNQLAT